MSLLVVDEGYTVLMNCN